MAVKILKGLNCEEKPAEFTQPYEEDEIEEDEIEEGVMLEEGGVAFKATIEEKMSVKSDPYATEAEETIASAPAPEAKRKKTSGGARKTKRRRHTKKKSRKNRKTRSK